MRMLRITDQLQNGIRTRQDKDDYILKLALKRYAEPSPRKGENISEDIFEDVVLQGTNDDYVFVTMTSVHAPNFSINEIRTMMRTLYVDKLSCPEHTTKIARREAAIVKSCDLSKVKCHN